MGKDKKYKGKSKPGKLHDPQTGYASSSKLSELFKGISISTLEQQEDEMRAYSLSLTPEERMVYLQDLIKIAYAHILNNPKENLWEKKIYIDRAK